ncbi:Glyoxalase-like domain protein [Tritonibacter multivorans]|uniref:Glyoxalase-like domain protein n=1 Tax=Tritonibacter multivorans TaxID=928856 RepID=A0A0P1GY78_9RHOB|nr:VOC family protein [Tritonibacter multivorans]MDA7420325.1 VOC family protein [Tritonibacter multivorans]CUH81814.1 Glyoxalase-like domain protein [Tritonibacter multivorans]SFC44304.1 Glyoxalase-like domain-containing protein [Tritonibacter multivorans]
MNSKPSSPTGVLEAALYVDDLDAAAAFYGGVLGFSQIQRVGNRHIFYRVGPSVLLLFNADETVKPPGNPALPVPPHGARGPGHLCFSQTRDDLMAMRDHLIAMGIEIEAEFDWPNGARSVYVRDPAGNSVEIAEPRLWDF